MDNSFNVDDLTLYETSFAVDGKTYILREASGGAVAKYRSLLLKGAKIGPDGKPTAIGGDMVDAEPLLVSLCVFETMESKDGSNGSPRIKLDKAGKPTHISTEVVTSWPHRLQKRLFDKIGEVSELNDRNTAERLKTQREEIDRKLALLANPDGQEDPAKNERDSTLIG